MSGLGVEGPPVENFQALPGRGVDGIVNGRRLVLGNHRLIHERGLCSTDLAAELAKHEQQGRTLSLLADDTRVLAFFAVADTIRQTSRQAIIDLKALGVSSVMLTGDNTATAQAIAAEAGIDEARGDMLPEAKLDAIKDLQQRYGATGMTGDGINDAPALAQADIGFAMGAAGTDAAMEAADVVIMNDDLQRVAETVRLSRRTHAILWQNIISALGIKAVFLVWAVFGDLHPARLEPKCHRVFQSGSCLEPGRSLQLFSRRWWLAALLFCDGSRHDLGVPDLVFAQVTAYTGALGG